MSDLNNLFTERKKTSPSSLKRLFADDSKDKRYNKIRSNEPHKSIRKYGHHANQNTAIFTSKDFTKRHIQKDDIKKQINYYNHQILLTFIRKNFFIMGAVILFNILFTSSQQILILSNMMLSFVFIQFQLGKDFVTKFYFLAGKEFAKILVYSFNFYLIFSQMRVSSNERKDTQIIIISLNGCINYLILSYYQPFLTIQGIDNKKPYQTGFEQLKKILFKIIKSYKMIYHLRKPIITINLIYWLLVLSYIMYQQSQILLANLINLQTVFTISLTAILLHTFIQIIYKINEVIIIQLISPNQKTLSMTLLRLDCQNKNNQRITNEVIKYIYQNCEIIWDVELLRHNYAINYDVIDDYIHLQLHKINECLLQFNRALINIRTEKKIRRNWPVQWALALRQVRIVHQVASLLQRKQYLFYVVEHIIYFQSYSDDFPVNTKVLHKKLSKTEELLAQVLQKITIVELKKSINTFYYYFHHNILVPFQ